MLPTIILQLRIKVLIVYLLERWCFGMNKAFCEIVKFNAQDVVITSGGNIGPDCPLDGGSTPCTGND